MAGKRDDKMQTCKVKKKTKRGTHLGTNLVAALACLQVNNLTHFQV